MEEENKVVEEVKDVPKKKRHYKKKKNQEKKKIYTPFELFYDEGLSKTGWAGLLHPLYKEVENWNKDKNEDNKFIFSQIKEKWGSLNLYNFGATEEQWKRIHRCEEASNHICMICGSPFNVGKTIGGWITTKCEDCAIEWGDDFQLQYDSVRITPIIKMALKLQKIGFYCDKIISKIRYKLWLYRGYMKFFFTHYILKSDKLDKTIFNYNKYK